MSKNHHIKQLPPTKINMKLGDMMEVQTQFPTYSIFIPLQEFKELRSDLWADDPVRAKLLTADKSYNIGIAYRGSHIRKFPKKSYQIFFSDRELHLNAEYIDLSYMRNKLSLDFFSDIGVLSPRTQHVQLKINGKNEGVYLQLESVDDLFLSYRNLPTGPIWYAENDDANFSLISPFDGKVKKYFEDGYYRKVGTDEDDERLSDLIYQINTLPRLNFGKAISKTLNVDKYLRWLAGVVCTQNYDGFIHNYALYCSDETGLFEIIPWDYDATWGRDINGREMPYDYVPVRGFNTLTARLLDDTHCRDLYRNILDDILHHQFTVDYLRKPVESIHQMLRPHVLKDPYFNESLTRYDDEPEYIFQFIEDRNAYLRKHLADID
jgi:spore coat protein H